VRIFFNQHLPLQMVVPGNQKGVPQQRLSTCSRPKVLWACRCSRSSSTISGKHRSSRSCTRRAKCRTGEMRNSFFMTMTLDQIYFRCNRICVSSYSMLWNLSWHPSSCSCLPWHTSCTDYCESSIQGKLMSCGLQFTGTAS